MEKPIRNMLRRVAALALTAVLSISPALAAAGTPVIRTTTTMMDGLTYKNTVSVNSSRRVESYSFELSPDSAVKPIMIQATEGIYGAGTINLAISRAKAMGYQVLGAINSDFFSMQTGVPIGLSIENGVYRCSNEGEYALIITEDGTPALDLSPQVRLSLVNQRTGRTTVPHNFNKYRTNTGGVYLYNYDFSHVNTHTSSSGWFIRMKPAEGTELIPLTVNSTITLQVTEKIAGSTASLAIGQDEYIMTAADQCGYSYVYDSYEVGDVVTLTTQSNDTLLSQAKWAGGVGDLIVWEGAIYRSNWKFPSGREPRSAFGVKADGTMEFYAVDGRQSSLSNGLTEYDLAEEMLNRGCVWAVNLDGGGSTALASWLPGDTAPVIRNSPSDGRPRSCATYLVLVTDQPGDGQANRLGFQNDGPIILAGSNMPIPTVVAMDSLMNPVAIDPGTVQISSGGGLGRVENGTYYAGTSMGSDTLLLESWTVPGLSGQGQINIVDSLSTLVVSEAGSNRALKQMDVSPGQPVQLTAPAPSVSRVCIPPPKPAPEEPLLSRRAVCLRR